MDASENRAPGDEPTSDTRNQPNDAAASAGPGHSPEGKTPLERSMVIETNRIREPDAALGPNIVMVPIAYEGAPATGRPPGGDGSRGGDDSRAAKDRGGREGDDEHQHAEKDHKGKPDRSEEHRDQKQGQPAHGPSLTRTLIYAGVVALVCGVVGAWGYSALFGSGKSGDHKSADKGSDSDKGKDSDKGSDSDKDPDSGKGSDSSGKDSEKGDLHQAQMAWVAAIKELRDARSAEKAAERSEEQSKAVLDFLKRTLLSAGRPGDGSLSAAFWSGGQGKDVTLGKAVDATEAKVAETFSDRPLAEASVRELLGQAYLNLGDPSKAVGQFERAYALRQAMQGAGDPDTADCRNQLAVAYRLAGRSGEGGRLFDRDLNSPAQASALAVRGAALLREKKPGEAELKLRESLTIRRKVQPDDWTTFDTQSLLGEALLEQNKLDEAEPLLVSGYEGLRQRASSIPPQDQARIRDALVRLVKLYETKGDTAKANLWRAQAGSLKAASNP